MSTSESLPAADPDFESRVRESFGRQAVMQTIGATLAAATPGFVEIHLAFDGKLTQQNGYLHAGIVTTIVDSACGYAAFTLAPPGAGVLTVEYKANFMAPARGETFVATGRVLKAGRTLTICQGEVRARTAGSSETVAAAMLATIMILRPA